MAPIACCKGFCGTGVKHWVTIKNQGSHSHYFLSLVSVPLDICPVLSVEWGPLLSHGSCFPTTSACVWHWLQPWLHKILQVQHPLPACHCLCASSFRILKKRIHLVVIIQWLRWPSVAYLPWPVSYDGVACFYHDRQGILARTTSGDNSQRRGHTPPEIPWIRDSLVLTSKHIQ